MGPLIILNGPFQVIQIVFRQGNKMGRMVRFEWFTTAQKRIAIFFLNKTDMLVPKQYLAPGICIRFWEVVVCNGIRFW